MVIGITVTGLFKIFNESRKQVEGGVTGIRLKRVNGCHFVTVSFEEDDGSTSSVKFEIVDGTKANPYILSQSLCELYVKLFDIVIMQLNVAISIKDAAMYPFKQLMFADAERLSHIQVILSWLNSLRCFGVFTESYEWFDENPNLKSWLASQVALAPAESAYSPYQFQAKEFVEALHLWLKGEKEYQLSLIGANTLLLVRRLPVSTVSLGYEITHWIVSVGLVEFKGG